MLRFLSASLAVAAVTVTAATSAPSCKPAVAPPDVLVVDAGAEAGAVARACAVLRAHQCPVDPAGGLTCEEAFEKAKHLDLFVTNEDCLADAGTLGEIREKCHESCAGGR